MSGRSPADRELARLLEGVNLPGGFPELLRGELMQSWGDGVRAGLEMAAKMTQALIDSGRTTDDQNVIAGGLRNAFRESRSLVVPAERERPADG